MLRPLNKSDAEFLCSIFKDNQEYYNIFFDSESEVSEWERRIEIFLKNNGIHHFIIEEEVPVGWFSYLDCPDQGEREVGILVIKKDFLHCGYGKKTFLEFFEICKKDHIHTILLSVNQNNERAINFYKKLGFEIYAEETIPQCNETINLEQYKMKLNLV